jgi:2,3-bisphosphoglycerate-independent phosphoglycerate mutase
MRRIALIILDGWGRREAAPDNAVTRAGTPRLSALEAAYPHTTLGAAGEGVGLPEGQMGNSEVGHLNLGAGRVVYQDLTRINRAVRTGAIFENPVLVDACDAVRRTGGTLHFFGLLSDGGVHSHQEHLYALLDLARRRGCAKIAVHAFLDGRDTPPKSGAGYVEALEGELAKGGSGRIATVMGRYYAMDRDTRWERVEMAYAALRRGEGTRHGSASEAVRAAYAEGQTDEFVTPRVIVGPDGAPTALLEDGDAVICYNFRADRAREITRALAIEGFAGFGVSDRPDLARYVCMTEYDETFSLPVAFPPESLVNILAEVLSGAGLKQLRIAETEKYAHVTFFFNGGVEHAYPGESRVLIASPRDVATYDQKPEMSAFGVRDRLLTEIGTGAHDCIVVNFANLDMVGHTGVMAAAEAAVRAVDTCVGDLVDALRESGYATLVTADHGNAEQMWDATAGQPMTAHTTNRVPFLLVDDERTTARLRPDGILADVAPTMLEIIGLAQPPQMTGRSLLVG